jgi:alpha-ribazole phosphatase
MTSALPPAVGEVTRLILVRHGEPDEQVHGRCYGQLDPGLSPRGREQMRRTWHLLENQLVAAIYSSPSRRAVESTHLRTRGRPRVATDERLREINFGTFEGLAYREIAVRYPKTYEQWMTRPTSVAFPGGETFAAMSARVRSAFEQIRQLHAGRTVAIVSHGGVNRVVLAAALDLAAPHMFRLDQAYACANVIDYFGDEPLVRLINAVVDQC